ncbi:multisubunit sodium/proton antiporter MrpD subunit [Actinomycetospora succinea]|uniref:Multisubunit sodium/proton antiporter MrpD subunit n=1 Tax=Actinomycetospora succinea TaxID=663603 RepID=A0A4R6UNB6_9PSEU|nr:Na+/H+ antiporter subunit D [Actinomycetospora succinea]TDQ46665.1 multisubunit sodium/proton antiporter MrpD subunit [Actinomycetospora succinea]
MNPGSSLLATIIPLPVLLPLLGAGATLVLSRRPTLQRALSVVVLTVVVVIAALLLVAAVQNGPIVVTVGSWPVPLGITLVVDPLSALMLLTSMTVTLAVLVYAIGQGVYDRDETTPITIFHPTYLVLAAGVANAFLSGDLFNLYVGFEVLLMASYVLLTLGGSRSRVRAGITYVVVNVVSSLVFLVGIALVYAAVGTLNLAQISLRMEQVPPGTALAIHLVLLTAFGIKAAVFPLSAWLPDSYPTAAAPVTAVFAGLLTKVGVYSIIRTETLIFPDSEVTQTILLVAAGLTMLVGALGAIAQADIKRILSFTLVSHIGYMIFGIALATPLGVAGAVFYVVHHITVQATLFCVVGLIEGVGGSTSVTRLGGLMKASPVLAVLWFIPAINLGGIPPLSGFVGKLGLVQAGVVDGSALAWVVVVVAVLTSLLTLYAVTKVWVLAFWRPADQIPVPDAPDETAESEDEYGDEDSDDEEAAGDGDAARPSGDGGLPGAPSPRTGVLTGVRPGTARTIARQEANIGAEVDWPVARLAPADGTPALSGRLLGAPGDRVSSRLPKVMAGATGALVALGLSLTVVAGPLYAVADQAADDLVARSPYISAVFAQTVDDRVAR